MLHILSFFVFPFLLSTAEARGRGGRGGRVSSSNMNPIWPFCKTNEDGCSGFNYFLTCIPIFWCCCFCCLCCKYCCCCCCAAEEEDEVISVEEMQQMVWQLFPHDEEVRVILFSKLDHFRAEALTREQFKKGLLYFKSRLMHQQDGVLLPNVVFVRRVEEV